MRQVCGFAFVNPGTNLVLPSTLSFNMCPRTMSNEAFDATSYPHQQRTQIGQVTVTAIDLSYKASEKSNSKPNWPKEFFQIFNLLHMQLMKSTLKVPVYTYFTKKVSKISLWLTIWVNYSIE